MINKTAEMLKQIDIPRDGCRVTKAEAIKAENAEIYFCQRREEVHFSGGVEMTTGFWSIYLAWISDSGQIKLTRVDSVTPFAWTYKQGRAGCGKYYHNVGCKVVDGEYLAIENDSYYSHMYDSGWSHDKWEIDLAEYEWPPTLNPLSKKRLVDKKKLRGSVEKIGNEIEEIMPDWTTWRMRCIQCGKMLPSQSSTACNISWPMIRAQLEALRAGGHSHSFEILAKNKKGKFILVGHLIGSEFFPA